MRQLEDDSPGMEKKKLRELMRAALLVQTDAEKHAFSRRAVEFIAASERWRNARAVALYAPILGEINCWPLLDLAWRQGKEAYLPKIIDARKRMMAFAPCGARDELEAGPYNIPQPRSAPASNPDLDLMLLPGLAFDRHGARTGYGGGYYDRYFAAHIGAMPYAIGFCYSFQIIDKLPLEKWDLRAQAVCSENGLFVAQ